MLRSRALRSLREMTAFLRRAFFKQSLAGILLLLVGSAPVAPLFLAAFTTACQMECCKRAGHCLCSRHGVGPGLDGVTSCTSASVRAAIAPSRYGAAASSAHRSVHAPHTVEAARGLPSVPVISSVTDFFLYQRPPPASSL